MAAAAAAQELAEKATAAASKAKALTDLDSVDTSQLSAEELVAHNKATASAGGGWVRVSESIVVQALAKKEHEAAQSEHLAAQQKDADAQAAADKAKEAKEMAAAAAAAAAKQHEVTGIVKRKTAADVRVRDRRLVRLVQQRKQRIPRRMQRQQLQRMQPSTSSCCHMLMIC